MKSITTSLSKPLIKLLPALALAASSLLVGCAGMNPTKPDMATLPDNAPSVSSELKNGAGMSIHRAFKAQLVDVEFAGSPAASEDFAKLVASKGFTVRSAVNNKELKAPKIIFMGAFVSSGGASKPINADLGDLLSAAYQANAGKSLFNLNVERKDTLITQSISQTIFDAKSWQYLFNSGIASRGFAIGNVLDSVGKATGVAGAFNTGVTGDPRGICGSKSSCENWYKIKQSLDLRMQVIGADASQSGFYRVIKTANYEKMVIPQLLGEAINDVLAVLAKERSE